MKKQKAYQEVKLTMITLLYIEDQKKHTERHS